MCFWRVVHFWRLEGKPEGACHCSKSQDEHWYVQAKKSRTLSGQGSLHEPLFGASKSGERFNGRHFQLLRRSGAKEFPPELLVVPVKPVASGRRRKTFREATTVFFGLQMVVQMLVMGPARCALLVFLFCVVCFFFVSSVHRA